MIKTLLLLLLITTPATASDYITPELCQEITTILTEYKDKGYIKEHEAEELIARCNDAL